MRRTLVASLLVFAALCLANAIAYACSCALPSIGVAAQHANVAFVGTITAVHEHKSCAPKHPKDCTSSFTYDITVEGVFKGTVANEATLDAGHGHGDCSRGSLGKHVVNTRWLVFSSSTEAPFSIRVCGGTQRATAKALEAVAKELGTAQSP